MRFTGVRSAYGATSAIRIIDFHASCSEYPPVSTNELLTPNVLFSFITSYTDTVMYSRLQQRSL